LAGSFYRIKINGCGACPSVVVPFVLKVLTDLETLKIKLKI
jgi:hypothetical protein